MKGKANNAVSRLAVEVAGDRLQAWIKPVAAGDRDSLSIEEALATLQEAKIAITDAVRKRCPEFIDAFKAGQTDETRFLIAEGRPATNPVNGSIEWHESFQGRSKEWCGDAPAGHYSVHSVVTVEEGAPIGFLRRAVPGQPGMDVFGNVLRPLRRAAEVQLDPTVRRSDTDPSLVVANRAGKVAYRNNCLAICEVVEIAGDAGLSCGNIDSVVDVSIKGTVMDMIAVHSKKSIRVNGAIQAATVAAGEDVVVRGGIVGRHKGSVRADGQVVAKFADEADIRARGDIRIAREVMNSQLRTDGLFVSPQASVVGGSLHAREGIEVGTLGNDAFVATQVAVDIHPDVIREANQINEAIKERQHMVNRIRRDVQPLMANLKRLTTVQKEQVTELLYRADTMEAEIKNEQQRRVELLENARARGTPYVLVSKRIHPGVRICMGQRHTVFHNEMAGPVRIESRKVGGATEFVAVNQLSGSLTVLPSTDLTEGSTKAGAREATG